ncbi:hypothetical protein [Candidatus Nitrospira bockiana]
MLLRLIVAGLVGLSSIVPSTYLQPPHASSAAGTAGEADPQSVQHGRVDWEDLKRAHQSGRVRAVVVAPTQAYDKTLRVWVEIPAGAELTTIHAGCTGWMNGFVHAGYDGRHDLYFREWDVRVTETLSSTVLDGSGSPCQRPSLTRELIVAAQREGLVQAFTNKPVRVMGENGALVYVGTRFRAGDAFEVEWLTRSTTGILRIPANRSVTIENEPCKPVTQVRITYGGGTFRIRAADLDVRIAGENLAKTPLGPAATVLCD